MAKKRIVLGLLVLAGIGFGSCASYSTVAGVNTPLGAWTSAGINSKATVVASYNIILGLITTGYEDFLKKVGTQEVDIVDTSYFGFFRVVKAVKRR